MQGALYFVPFINLRFQNLRLRGSFRHRYNNPEIPSIGVLGSFLVPFVLHGVVRRSGPLHATNISYFFSFVVLCLFPKVFVFSVLPLCLDRLLCSNSACFEGSNTNYTPVTAILDLSCFPI